VIEIDTGRPWPEAGSLRRGRPRPAGGAIVIAFALLAVLTGPTPTPPPALDAAWRVETTTEYFWLSADTVYTVDRDGAAVSLTARDATSGAPRWRHRLTGALAEVYANRDSFLSSNFPPDATTGVRTNIVSTQGGLPRLAFPTAALPLAYVGARVALVIDRDPTVPPDPAADGRTRAMGLDWTHTATAFDLVTGRPRWTRRLPAGTRWALPGVRAGADGLAGLPPGRDWMVTSTAAGEARVWDLASGSVVWRRAFGRLEQQAYVIAFADAVVVRRDDAEPSTIEAYEPDAPEPRWRLVPAVVDAEPVGCEPLVCLVDGRSVWVVDPRNGATVWRSTGPLLRPATPGRVVVMGYGNQVTLIDTRRGRAIPTEPGWRVVDHGGYTRSVVVARVYASGDRADLAVLDVATGNIRRLGRVSDWAPTSRCLVAGLRVACGDGKILRVWRAPG